MIAKIIIKRKFLKGNEKQIIALLNKIRTGAMSQSGYISGETLVQYHKPQHLTVIGTWQTMEDWRAWKKSREREKLENMLQVFQAGLTQYEEYYLGTSSQ